MKLLLHIAIILAMGYMVVCYTDAEEKEFADFKIEYEKSYATPEEEAKRKEIYFATVKKIKKHNVLFHQGKVSYTLGINQFADMLPDEIPMGIS